ncbi:MAG: type II toxin-antitoxin system death-on-curing family toxin [Candidatus Omnitrophica bacterium]|nr:type II toxin-antitoxin system death-on-curing family toxin [Candidatus Omnitrophota bacterium]
MQEPEFLTLAEVLEIHSEQVRRFGGQPGLRDMGLLESALAQPEASFAGEWLHRDLYGMAAAYAYHLCQNHCFIDGNKRTALSCALIFLKLNEVHVVDTRGRLKDTLLGVASGKVDKETLADVFRSLSVRPKKG